MDINKIEIGDLFSENGLYKVINQCGDTVEFLHINSGKEVAISTDYIEDHLVSGDQFESTVECGIKDKYYTSGQIDEIIKQGKFKNELEIPKVDSLRLEGLQTIFHKIPVGKVFTVEFIKKGKELSPSQVEKKKQQLIAEAIKRIEAVQKAKKGVKEQATKELSELLNTNISNFEAGEKRKLRGIKTENYSNTGYYNVRDLDQPEGKDSRLVNINTLESIIVDNVRYVLEK